MYCAISGEVPKEPVVAKTTGLVFEKRLILKALKEEKKCPVTRTNLTEEDLLNIASNPIAPLRPAAPTSVPNLLHSLQQEWDETVLETFTLRQQLDTTRKELAHALYQYDAACRVIARLIKERDEAYGLLKNFEANGQQNGSQSTKMEESAPQKSEEHHSGEVAAEIGISEAVIEELNAVCKKLSSGRKQRKPSEFLQSKENMAQIQETHKYAPHKHGNGKHQEIVSMSLKHTEDDNHLLLTGSTDHSIVLSGLSNGQVHSKMHGHKGAVNSVAFSPNTQSVFFSASEDKTVKIWQSNEVEAYTEKKSILHTGSVSSVTVHPSGNYLVSSTTDGSWNFLDATQGLLLKSVRDEAISYTSTFFHPDGLILGTGTGHGALKIWDVREQKHVTDLLVDDHNKSSVKSVCFSENGYLSAAGYSNGEVKIWDLRKLSCVKSFQLGSSPINAVSFDYSGVYLAIGGGGEYGGQLQVKVVKDWSTLTTIGNAHDKEVSQIAWTTHAASLVSTSLDGSVRVFSK